LKSIILVLAALVSAAAVTVNAADKAEAKKELTPQQQRMSDCSKQSKGLKGDAHKKFMSDCLKGETPAPAVKQTQQEKMKSCNTEASAKKLKGDERKAFMSTCLKG
jgi:psiF repeat